MMIEYSNLNKFQFSFDKYFSFFNKNIPMNCKLCMEPYRLDDSRKLPRVLTQCGHTFCNQCLRLHLINSQQFICRQCNKSNFLFQNDNFPLNSTLISILQNSQNGLCQFLKESQICKKHNKKLQAYCENDQLLLCLTCILTQHKSHKIISIPEKVKQEKQNLKNCQVLLQKSQQILVRKEEQCKNLVDRLNLDFNEYVFEINLLCKSIVNQLKESEQKFISNAKKNIEKQVKEVQKVESLVKQKMSFYVQLTNISRELDMKSDVQFIRESNKQLFILENSQLKQSFNLSYEKEEIHKQKILNQIIKSLQQFVLFQRKKVAIQNDKKMSRSNKSHLQNQNHFSQKLPQKPSKPNNKEDFLTKSINQSPCRLQKKSVSGVQKGGKEPQILQVNLMQKYQKHLQAKHTKKRNSQILVSKGKSPKIQYEVKRQNEVVQKPPMKYHLQCQNSTLEGSAKKIKLVTCSIGSSAKKGSESQKSINHCQFNSNKTDDFALSFLNQSHILASPQRFRNSNQTFDAETPVSINSFMESSQCTVFQQRKDDTILKNSRSFTIFCAEQKVFHFGGLKNSSISCQKVLNNTSELNLVETKVGGSVQRSKSQCVILRSFNPKKCLILGGKDLNGERSKQIFSYDWEMKKIERCQMQLNEAISGFGAVVFNEKLYVFGGSSFSALKTLHQYKLARNGFQVKKLSSMINSRDELGFALGFDQFLYVGGGINPSNLVLNSFERYCFKTNKWHSIAAMKIPRRSFTLVSLPNGLYAIGGHDGKSYLKSVQMYDFDSQSWVQVAAMNQARFTHSAVCTSDYQNIIVFGGFENKPLKQVEVYNVVENKWTVINKMEEERFLHCSILIQE